MAQAAAGNTIVHQSGGLVPGCSAAQRGAALGDNGSHDDDAVSTADMALLSVDVLVRIQARVRGNRVRRAKLTEDMKLSKEWWDFFLYHYDIAGTAL